MAGVSFLSACGDSVTAPNDDIVEGVNLAELFARPTSAEIAIVDADWAGRDPAAQAVEVVVTRPVTLGVTPTTLQIVSHLVDGARHYGAVLAPDGKPAASLPLLIYTHGGDGGIDIDDLLPLLPFVLGGLQDDFVLLAPSFRSETLVFEGTAYPSAGTPSPWDRDVDDALALLNVALTGMAPAADPDRIGVLGFSRGAAVALLMAIRDPRIDLVVEFFGPTDFFSPFARGVFEEALRGNPRDLPGLDALDAQFIQPLKRGALSIAEVRLAMLRRSPVYFADRLPDLQVHHGTEDDVVPVSEAERLIEALLGLGRGEPTFQHFIYEGGTHDPRALVGSISRTRAFLGRLTASSVAGRSSLPRYATTR